MDCSSMSVKLLSGNNMPLIGCTISKANIGLILFNVTSLILFTSFIFFLVGTFQIRGRQLIYDVLNNALNAGFRSFGKYYFKLLNQCFYDNEILDTAAVYGNEQDIGLALKELLPKYNLKREDVFITSKLCKIY